MKCPYKVNEVEIYERDEHGNVIKIILETDFGKCDEGNCPAWQYRQKEPGSSSLTKQCVKIIGGK